MNTSSSNRRRFLMGAAAAAGAMSLGGSLNSLSAFAAPAPAAGARKTVTIGGRRMRVVDIHAHCVIPAAEAVIQGTGVEGDFPRGQVLGPQRIAAMDQRGIDVQVLSINGYWWYAANRDVAARIVRTHDEGIAAWVKANPTRFVALTSPSLQHPDLAAEQLDYAVKTLGMRGASVGGNVRGEMISSEKYDPFWRKAEELQVPIFMHPTNADFLVNDNTFKGRGDLGNIIGNPMETTLFLSSLIFDGTLDRFPRLKVCGAHGGGYLPSYFARTQVTCDVRPNARCANKKNPREYLRSQIMADTMVFTDEGLRHLVNEMGTSQIVYGTDIPFNWPDTLDLVVNASFLTDAQKEAIIGGNLINLLKIT
jgi:aminocarboxymuconate-semialdehyde decarboxylase